MDVMVLSKLGQAFSRHLSGSSLVGNSMLVRLRSGTIGLLGLVAAVGLGLIAVISQQGLPGVSSGPLPERPPGPFVQHETIALPKLAASIPVGHRPRPKRSRSIAKQAPTPAVSAESEIAGSHQVAAPAGHSLPVAHPPSSNPGTQAQPPQPDSPTPPATTVAVAPPPAQSPAAEEAAVPAAVEPEDESPGHSGEHHGHAPPWAGHGHGHGHDSPSHHEEPPSYEPPAVDSPEGDDISSEGDSGDHGHHSGDRGRQGWTGR
jgi:hypothetical protein